MTYDCQTNPCPGCSIRRASPAARRPPLGRFADLLGFALCLALVAVLAVATGCEDSSRDSPPQDSAPGVAATASDPLPPGAVRWCYGGFDGSRAAFDARCRISSLRVNNPSGLSLKWLSGIPGDWAKDQNGLVIFALFFQAEDGSWKGGKIDWINAARSTRDLKNPASGYGGWNWAEYLRAKKHAAVVVSADGRKRSNWIFD